VEREEEKSLVIERILILVRNVLQVPADLEGEKRADSDVTVHDQVIPLMLPERAVSSS
jgi:timeless